MRKASKRRNAASNPRPNILGDQTMEYQTVLIGDNELSRQDLNAISEMVHDALREIGIETESFAWHIEVEYIMNK